MNTLSPTTPSPSATGPREDWLRAGVLAGFLATFAMTVVLVGAYWLAAALGDPNGNTLQQWFWALVHNPVAERTVDGVVLAIGANLAMGLLLALVYARFVEPLWNGPDWWEGVRFSLVLWLLSLIIFLPLMGGGFFGMSTCAGPLPIIGNLILHLVYGAVLGTSYAEATEDWLDDTEADHLNAAAAERGAAGGVLVGAVVGLIAGWLVAPAFAELADRSLVALGVAFIGAAIGLGVGSFAGMGRSTGPTQGPAVRH